MDIPQEIQKCVGFVGYHSKRHNIFRLGGTAFFMFVELNIYANASYIITAKHVLHAIRDNSSDRKLFLRVNLKNGTTAIIETSCDDWIEHPEAPIDVAVLPFQNTTLDLDHSFINTKAFALGAAVSLSRIRVGEEIFITGLFVQHPGNQRNIPIVRVGTIAAMPGEKIHIKNWGDFEAYLIEARSISGLSGSPVFSSCDRIPSASSMFGQQLIDSENKDDPGFCLMGLMLGHFDSDGNFLDADDANVAVRGINTGIGMVVPAEKIQEALDCEILREQRKRIEERSGPNGATLD